MTGVEQDVGIVGGILLTIAATYVKLIRPALRAAKSIVGTKKENGKEANGLSLRSLVLDLSSDVAAMRKEMGEQRGMFHASLALADKAVFITNDDGATTWVNRTFCALFGIAESEALHYNWLTLVTHRNRSTYFEDWKQTIELGNEFDRVVEMEHKRTGALMFMRVVARPMGGDSYIGSVRKATVGEVERYWVPIHGDYHDSRHTEDSFNFDCGGCPKKAGPNSK